MLKRLCKKFHYGQKGFTLIELLVVVAILGVLAAVAIPNVAKFIGAGKTQAAATEAADVQTAITAAMANAQIGTIVGLDAPGTSETTGNFGNTTKVNPPVDVDLPVVSGGTLPNGTTVGAYISSFIAGGSKVNGDYYVFSDGSLIQIPY